MNISKKGILITFSISKSGALIWRNNKGQLHREDGPACIRLNGIREYWQNGQRHREDGPAIIYLNGYKAYFQNGQRHREDGPANIYSDGVGEYWLKGIRYYSEKEYYAALKKLK